MHNLNTNSPSFWPIYHWRSTDTPPTINGQRIGRVLAAILTETSADSWSICLPSLGWYPGWYIGRYVDRHISVDISTDTRPICRPTYRSTLGRYVDRSIGRMSADMTTKCTKYKWSNNYNKKLTSILNRKKICMLNNFASLKTGSLLHYNKKHLPQNVYFRLVWWCLSVRTGIEQ